MSDSEEECCGVQEAELSFSEDEELSCDTACDADQAQQAASPEAGSLDLEHVIGWDSSAVPSKPATTAAPAPLSQHRMDGNEAFKRGEHARALEHYARGLACGDLAAEEAAALHSNAAACHLHLDAAEKAATAAAEAAALLPGWWKPWLHLARARMAQQRWRLAAEAAARTRALAGAGAVVSQVRALDDELAVQAFQAGSLAGFGGLHLEVRSAGEEAWLGRASPYDPALDGPEPTEPGQVATHLPAPAPAAQLGHTPQHAGADPGPARPDNRLALAPSSAGGTSDTLGSWTAPQGPRRTSFRSLHEALKAARDGDVITLLRGTHNGLGEAMVVDKRVLIQGEGLLGETVIDQRANSPTLRLTRQGVVVRNLVLDHTGFKEAVHCCMEGGGSPGAGPLLQGLEIKCSGDDGVNASGRARLTLADCRLRAKKSAIRAYGDARVVARDCVAEACGEAGVKVMDAAALACERCVVAGCQEEAAVVMDSGTLTCRDCTLRDCKGPGLDVSGSGRARLTQTDIHDNVGGVWLWDAGAAEAAHCKLEGGPSFALMADTDARAAPKAALQRCHVVGKVHAPAAIADALGKGNRMTPPTRHIGWPLEDGPFQFIPNPYTRKQ